MTGPGPRQRHTEPRQHGFSKIETGEAWLGDVLESQQSPASPNCQALLLLVWSNVALLMARAMWYNITALRPELWGLKSLHHGVPNAGG